MTKDELAQFDGRQGSKAYVAVNGKVYDVTASSYWQGGDHQGAHQAGSDLSTDLLRAPHVRSVIERYPVVAELVEAPLVSKKSGGNLVGIILGGLVLAAVLLWLLLR